jgi:pimeloyl-ACP methyl ester carboxylesterase
MRSTFFCFALLIALVRPCVFAQVVLDTVFTPPDYEQGPLLATVTIPNVPNGVGVVLTHGTNGTRQGLSVWCDTLAAHGYTAMTIDYFDFPSYFGFYPYPVLTFKVAVQFLRRNADRFMITTGKIVGLGQSEGAMHWGECIIWDNDYAFFGTDPNISDHLDAAVLLYGIYDMQHFLTSEVNVDSVLRAFFSGDSSFRTTKGDCIANVGNITTPLLLFHGSGDRIVDIQQSIELRDSLVARGSSCQLVTDTWGHAFDMYGFPTRFSPAGIVAKDLTLAFLQSTVLTTTVPSGPVSEVTHKFTLAQNFPNPFNPSTTIKFELPSASRVTLSMYDALGRQVCVLVNERREAGVHEVKFDGSGLSSGVYFYRLQAGDFVQTKELAILK